MGNAVDVSKKNLIIYKAGGAEAFLDKLAAEAKSTGIPSAYRLSRKKVFLDKSSMYGGRPFGMIGSGPLPEQPSTILVLRDNVVPSSIISLSDQAAISDAMIFVNSAGSASIVYYKYDHSPVAKPLSGDQALTIIQNDIALRQDASHRPK